jgi:hypothetical protein
MRVLLVSPNIESLPDPVFPLGPAYLAGALRENGIPCRVLDLCFVQDYEAAIAGALQSFQPDVVCLSIRNIDNVSYPNTVSYLPFYLQVAQSVRQKTNATLILGGSGFSLLPEELIRYMKADLGIVGEGEQALVSLIRQLEAGSPAHPAGTVLTAGLAAEGSCSLDGLCEPDRSGFDGTAYFQQGGMGNIQTKRGCPFGCIYCTYPLIEGSRVRLRSPGRVCDELEHMIARGITSLFFVDNEFNYPAEHAAAVCREIIARKLPVEWSCYAHPAFVTRGLIDLMRAAGCTGLEFGSDAAQPAMLRSLGKNFTVKQLVNASAICREAEMPFCHSLLLGGPGETMATVEQTLEAILAMSATAVVCMIGIRIFPRTVLAGIAGEDGVASPETDFLKPVFYLSPFVKNDIVGYMEQFSKRHRSWIFPGLNIKMHADLQRKLRKFGMKGPLWEHMNTGGRVMKG